MNLIEQFGSYEKAKEYLRQQQEMPTHELTEDSIVTLPIELLEHRRANNIFEESDKIVFIDDFMHGELMTVAWTRKGEVWMDDGAKRCTDLSMIRHATYAEIAAGHRLPTCEVLDDADIPTTAIILEQNDGKQK